MAYSIEGSVIDCLAGVFWAFCFFYLVQYILPENGSLSEEING